MADNELKRTRPRCRCNIQWLLLVLMLTALAAWVYKGDEVQRYGEKAMAKSNGAVGWLAGLGNKARHAYQCAKTDGSVAPVSSAAVTQSVMPPAAAPAMPAAPEQGAAPCCPTCKPCGNLPPYVDLSDLMSGHHMNMGSANTGNVAASPAPSAPVTAKTAPAAPVANTTTNAPSANVATAPNVPAATGKAIVPPNYPDHSGMTAVPPNYPPYPGMPRYDARTPVAEPSPIAAPKPFVNSAPILSKDLLRARNWVAQKKLAYAAIAYRKHVAAYPDDANGYGELGNVYLLSKLYPEAAQSYYEAGTRLLDAGYVDVVMPLMPVIMQYQPALGSRLKAKMTFMGKQND